MAEDFDFAGAGSFLSGLSSLGGLFGGGGLSARKSAALEAQYNREVMQNQIQWRTADAKAAGVHPIYALGAPAVSFAPSVAGGNDSAVQRISEAGQGISRAAQAFSDSKQRRILFDQEVRMNDLKIKDAEIALQKSASDMAMARTGATVPMNGSGAGILVKPSETTFTRKGDRSLERAGPAPAVKEFVNRDGSVTIWPSADAKQAIEDSMYEWEHMYRNRFVPFWKQKGAEFYDNYFR